MTSSSGEVALTDSEIEAEEAIIAKYFKDTYALYGVSLIIALATLVFYLKQNYKRMLSKNPSAFLSAFGRLSWVLFLCLNLVLLKKIELGEVDYLPVGLVWLTSLTFKAKLMWQ
jgi:hypothetical protein